jgi:hypothetical protein
MQRLGNAQQQPSALPRRRPAPRRERFRAARTARSTSSDPPAGIEATGVRRPGFSTISVAPDVLSTQAPSISIRAWRGWLAAGRVCSVIDMGKPPGYQRMCYVAMAIAAADKAL